MDEPQHRIELYNRGLRWRGPHAERRSGLCADSRGLEHHALCARPAAKDQNRELHEKHEHRRRGAGGLRKGQHLLSHRSGRPDEGIRGGRAGDKPANRGDWNVDKPDADIIEFYTLYGRYGHDGQWQRRCLLPTGCELARVQTAICKPHEDQMHEHYGEQFDQRRAGCGV